MSGGLFDGLAKRLHAAAGGAETCVCKQNNEDIDLEARIDRLICSAYLLTLDVGKAFFGGGGRSINRSHRESLASDTTLREPLHSVAEMGSCLVS
jgi:hypothetical protein